mgnify:CR=1 FL=1
MTMRKVTLLAFWLSLCWVAFDVCRIAHYRKHYLSEAGLKTNTVVFAFESATLARWVGLAGIEPPVVDAYAVICHHLLDCDDLYPQPNHMAHAERVEIKALVKTMLLSPLRMVQTYDRVMIGTLLLIVQLARPVWSEMLWILYVAAFSWWLYYKLRVPQQQ